MWRGQRMPRRGVGGQYCTDVLNAKKNQPKTQGFPKCFGWLAMTFARLVRDCGQPVTLSGLAAQVARPGLADAAA